MYGNIYYISYNILEMAISCKGQAATYASFHTFSGGGRVVWGEWGGGGGGGGGGGVLYFAVAVD